MAPSSLVLDVWSHLSDQEKIVIDVLLPNGIFINLEVCRDATLLETKEDVWEAAQQLPLYGLLHDMDSYVFVCVNPTTAEQEEQIDELRRLCDVRPFQAVLRLVERKGDKAEKILNSQIRFLLGKGLHEFDAQKDPEINEFRTKMRLFSEDICRQKISQSWQEKLLRNHPIQLGSTPVLPEYLITKLNDGKLVMSISMNLSGSEWTFKISVSLTINATELLETIADKKAIGLGMVKANMKNFILKVCGSEEYFFGPDPLLQYKYIQDCIAFDRIPELLLVNEDSVQLDDECDETLLKLVDRPRTRSFHDPSTLPRRPKQITVSSWTVDDPFSICINSIHKLNCENKTKVVVQLGVFHGSDSISSILMSRDESVEDGKVSYEENFVFKDLAVSNIPRMARICFCVCEVSRSVRNSRAKKFSDTKQDLYMNPIAWANTTVYDFKGILKNGPVTLHMWPYNQDLDIDGLLNPLGGNICNPNKDQAAVLTVTFSKHHEFSTLMYPNREKVLEYASRYVETRNGRICPMPQASKSHLEQLRQICERDPLYELHEQEKELMWFLRQSCCHQLPQSLPKLLRCVKWNDKRDVAEITSLLHTWPSIPPPQALELLDYAYADQAVRSYAVDCLKLLRDEELSLYLLQLVQAVKHEPYLQCDLVRFLLKRALRNRHIGHKLFWLLRSEMKFPEVTIRFGLILEAYCRGALEHIKCLSRQVDALNKLKIANELVQADGVKKKEGRERLKNLIQELLAQGSYKDSFAGLRNPLDPKCKFGKLKVDKCKFMDSKMKPLWLAFENYDSHGKDIFVIFKSGDDLRQDMLTLQMIRIVDKMWKDEGLDLRMIPYQCLAVDYKVGFIEVVPNADTIANIQKEKGFTAASAFKKGCLLAWLKDHNPDEKSLDKAIQEFTLSCAGYSVFTYVLGVADRHSDNIMVKTNGQLFHVDFGHILGKFKEKFGIKRERVPFVLTHDFVYIITKGNNQKSEEFNRFQQYCEQAFIILRRKGPLMISLFAMMLSTGIPELASEKDLDYLRETLVLDMSEQEALRHFRSRFDDALSNSWKTSVNWMAHNWAKDNKMAD